ncbi:MAG TPA: hypothetical protein VFX28_09775, partial [Methylomirabilota bacterium]|nr:hypothetical protein [Methylomirabilota bacterium]
MLSIPSTSFAPPPPVTALAPFEILLDGATDLVGVAVAADDTVFVSDRSAGLVYRRAPSGAVTTLVSGLQRPAGLALDAAGGLLIAEEQAGRVLRYQAGGGVSVVASGIRTPRWLAPGAAGQLYVSAHRLSGADGPDPDEGRQIVLHTPGAGLAVVASGIRKLEGLVLLDGALVAASKGLEDGADSAGVLLRYPVAAGGQLGAAQPWVATGLKQPVGLVPDVLDAVFVSTKELTALPDPTKRAVGKLHVDLRLTGFAEGFDDP